MGFFISETVISMHPFVVAVEALMTMQSLLMLLKRQEPNKDTDCSRQQKHKEQMRHPVSSGIRVLSDYSRIFDLLEAPNAILYLIFIIL